MGLFLTDPNCIKQREFVGLPAWDAYKGKGITIFHDDTGDTGHNGACVDIIKTILPESKVLSGSIYFNSANGAITSCNICCNETGDTMPFDEFIVKYNVSQINNSTDGIHTESAITSYMKEKIKKFNLFCTGSAGNFGTSTNKYQGAFVMVSGVDLLKDGSITDYGTAYDGVDFSMFMGFQDGTSFSAPFLNAMGGKIRSRFGNLTQDEIYLYLKNHCMDLGTSGKDQNYGWGLPILGNEKLITLIIGSNVMTVDGVEIKLDTVPIIDKNGRTLVPVRAISESLGCQVLWDNTLKKITIIG